MATINPFATGGFELAHMTRAINVIPNMYGRLQDLGIFRTEGITTRSVIVDEINGVLNLLPTARVGTPATQGRRESRVTRSFVVPHIPHEDVILPEDVQGIRGFGMEDEPDPTVVVMNRKLETLRRKHAITLEYHRMGAIKGIVYDADGSTVIYNYFTEFGITLKQVDFVLGTGTTDVLAKCMEVARHIEDNLKGETMSRIHVLVSAEFFDKLVAHANVKEAYKYWAAVNPLKNDMRRGFEFGGIMFEEYRGTATDAAGNNRRFIAANHGWAFPLGTQDTFVTYFAPANFMETVNTVGLELYAKQEQMRFGTGIEVHSQSNPLAMCKRPALIVNVLSSN